MGVKNIEYYQVFNLLFFSSLTFCVSYAYCIWIHTQVHNCKVLQNKAWRSEKHQQGSSFQRFFLSPQLIFSSATEARWLGTGAIRFFGWFNQIFNSSPHLSALLVPFPRERLLLANEGADCQQLNMTRVSHFHISHQNNFDDLIWEITRTNSVRLLACNLLDLYIYTNYSPNANKLSWTIS